jgi:membrane protein implicated in regulation of membrane protease activity
MHTLFCLLAAAALVGLAAEPAWAYVGPGAGLSLLSAFWTLLVATLAAIGFLVMWPLRRRLRRADGQDALVQPQRSERDSDATNAARRDIDRPPR